MPNDRSDAPPSQAGAPSLRTGLLAQASIPRRLRTALRLWRLYWLRLQLLLAPTETQRLFLLTILIGALCGLAAVGFHESITAAEHYLIGRAMGAEGHAWIPWTVLTPTLGGLVCGALLEWVFPGVRGSGIPQVKTAFALRGGRARLRDSFGKFVVGTLQIGSGGSLGREGPTVQICAGIASTAGRVAKVSPKSLRRLLPVGAAAGIAAAFNAPIAAVTFTIEEVVGNLDQSVLSGVIVAAALAAVIERSILGEHPVFDVPTAYGLHHFSSLVVFAVLGLAAAGVSIAFTDGLLKLREAFRTSRVPRWAQPGVGGFATGALAAGTLYFLHVRGVNGGGYQTLSDALSGKLAVEVMLALCAVKIAATVASYSSGGAGGIFAPALFMGAMLGGAFGALDIRLFGHGDNSSGAFALVGMGAVFAGVIRAPMTSVLIIIEMTGGYSLILPLMIANMTAYGIARRLRPSSVYEALLEQDGITLHTGILIDGLESLRVSSVYIESQTESTVTANEPARVVDGAADVLPVVDAEGAMVGLMVRDDVDALRREGKLAADASVADLMRAPLSVKLEDDLRTAFDLMVQHGVGWLPVVGRDHHVVGFVDEAIIAKAYLRVQAHGGHGHRQSHPS